MIPTHRMSSLQAWLKSQGYWKYGRDASSPFDSHLFLDGGKASVPDEMIGTMNNVMAHALAMGEPIYVVEKKPPVFRMFFDLDMKSRHAISDETLLTFVRDVHAGVVDVFGAVVRKRAIVCLSEPDFSVTGKGWKTGVHIVWPDIATVSTDALTCRAHVVDRVRPTYAAWFTNDMDAVIDKCVLEKNGMRTIGSRKKTGSTGVYWPRYVIENDDSITPVPDLVDVRDFRYWIAQTSLRVCPAPLRRLAAVSGTGTVSERDEETLLHASHGGSLAREPLTRELADLLAKFSEALVETFGSFRFTSLYRGGTEESPTFIARSTSNYCLNIGRRHRSNNVYFLFTTRGAYQMCFCRCETVEGRKNGLCQDFHSAVVPISNELKVIMFGANLDAAIRPAPTLDCVVDRELDALLAYCAGTRPRRTRKR